MLKIVQNGGKSRNRSKCKTSYLKEKCKQHQSIFDSLFTHLFFLLFLYFIISIDISKIYVLLSKI